MSVELFIFAVAIVFVLIATIIDVKERWVPDFISFSFIAFGLISAVLLSLMRQSIDPLKMSLIGGGVFLSIGILLFYVKMWGGADFKILTALGLIFPVYPTVFQTWFNPIIAPWPFFGTLWFNVMIFGALSGIVASFYLAIKHHKKLREELRVRLSKLKKVIYGLAIFLVISIVILLMGFSLLLAIWAVAVILFYLSILLKTVEDNFMFKTISPKKLIEGDWIVDKIKVGGKVVYTPERLGITKKNIELLQKLEKQGKLKHIVVKEGIPFMVPILIGLLYSIAFGDLLIPLFLQFV